MNIKRVIITLLALGVCGSVAAQVPSVEARVEQDSVWIGDRFTYSIIVERDLVQVVEFPQFTPEEGSAVELVETYPVDTLEQSGRRIKLRQRYDFTTFEEGRHNLGVAQVLYIDKNIVDTLSSKDSIMLDVLTFEIDSTSQSIFDLKAQRKTPFKFAEVRGYSKWGVVIILLLIIAICALQRVLAARGKRLRDIFKPTPPPPPHIEAIAALEELHNQKLWQNEKFKEYYSSLTHILRHYIARRYEVAAMEMTSEEIIEALKEIDIPARSKMDLTQLLREADLVKFAKATPEGEENESHYLKAYYFVEETKIQEEASPTAEEDLYDVTSGKNSK